MENLKSVLQNSPESYDANFANDIYFKFTNIQIETETDQLLLQNEIAPLLSTLASNNIISLDLLYLSLIPNPNKEDIYKCLKTKTQLDFKSYNSVFNYCIEERKHWFLALLNSLEENPFSEGILRKLYAIKLLGVSNNFDVTVYEDILQQFNVEDKFINLFICEMNYLLDLSSSCSTRINKEDCDLSFYQQDLLTVFSEHLDLKETHWDLIKTKLKTYEVFLKDNYKIETYDFYKPSDVFLAYTILYNLLYCLKLCRENNTVDNITKRIEAANNNLIEIENSKLTIEILENVFVLLFIENKHILSEKENSAKLYCSEIEIRMITCFLKENIEKILRRNVVEKSSGEYMRLRALEKILMDTIWRFELVQDILGSQDILNYMFASPESLIYLCLKNNNFGKAKQVIQIFNLNDSPLAKEILYTEQVILLKDDLTKSYKLRNKLYKNETPVSEIISTFLKRFNNENQEVLDDSLDDKFIHCKTEEDNFIDVCDLAFTCSENREKCNELWQITDFYNPEDLLSNKFLKEFRELYKENVTASTSDILCSPQNRLNIIEYRNENELYSKISALYDDFKKQLKTQSDSNQNLYKTFFNCQEILARTEDKDSVKYFSKLFNYLREFSKIFYTEKNNATLLSPDGKEVSYFSILEINRTELFGKLIYERNMEVLDFESLFSKLQLDLLYHTAANCFPYIPVNVENISNQKNLIRMPEKHMLTYIQKRNWLLAYLVSDIHNQDREKAELNEARIKNFLQLKKLKETDVLKSLYNDNSVVAVLQHNHTGRIIDYFYTENVIFGQNNGNKTGDFRFSSDSFETAQEMLEGDLKSVNWKHYLNIINAIPEKQFKNCSKLVGIKDEILCNVVIDGYEQEYYRYVLYIVDDTLRINTVFNNFKTWPSEFCIEYFQHELYRFKTVEKYREDFEDWLKKITMYQEINDMLNCPYWFEVEEMSQTEPELVLNKILKTNKIDLLLKFIDTFDIPQDCLTNNIHVDYFLTIFHYDTPLGDISKLFAKLPSCRVTEIISQLLKHLRNLDHLEYLIENLVQKHIQSTKDDNTSLTETIDNLTDIRVSLRILRCFTDQEQSQLWCLIETPLDIIETLIMNTKLDYLDQVLKGCFLRPSSTSLEGSSNSYGLTAEEMDYMRVLGDRVDVLLREYAEKSLEVRVVTELHPRLLQKAEKESKLMQSMDSLYGSENVHFLMPEQVPSKLDWIANNEIVECMCCQQTVFSMFNRRHHCRRCGRVVCFNCSLRRMNVDTYGDILVRVCLDCFQQSHVDGESSRSEASYKSIIYDYWLLGDNAENNKIVREEFSYEHAPSVSLCLAIMKHHSKSIEHPKFLLEQCSHMMKLLQPLSKETTHEVDYSLIIKMIKSLAIATKIVSTDISYQSGITDSERILSQADLLGLLVERGCLNLLPKKSNNTGVYVDAGVLRRLRDSLIEREQWNFALEVSTKAGLDNTGVFAAWGKSYLKAGSLQYARDKFQRCFDKTAHYDFTDFHQSTDIDCSTTTTEHTLRSRHSSKLSQFSFLSEKTGGKTLPPLLNEIIHILESSTTAINRDIIADLDLRKQKLSFSTQSLSQSVTSHGYNNASSMGGDCAMHVATKLKNLAAVKAGNYATRGRQIVTVFDENRHHSGRRQRSRYMMEAILFDECVFYLTKYGTYLSLLEFYIRHERIDLALTYIVENRLTSDVFIEVYMICLKEGVVNVLQENLSELDSTLDIWKNHLRNICRHLEKQNLLNSLYQLQQFMGDFVRAAMTCIRFYKHNASRYTELADREHYLDKAKSHLNQDLEQDQWVEVATVRKLSTDSPESFEEKGLTNPSLVMKVDSKNIDKYIVTINNQIALTKILAKHEAEGRMASELLTQISTILSDDSSNIILPTLFGSQNERVQLSVLTIICDENIEDGYSLAYKIIHEYKLKPIKVYCHSGKLLAQMQRYEGIAQLVSCLKSSGINDTAVTDMCDGTLSLAVRTLMRQEAAAGQIEGLIKLITDRATKISAYIECKQLKSAYLLAVRYNRIGDIRRILREAELLNKPDIKKLCQKILQAHAHSPNAKE